MRARIFMCLVVAAAGACKGRPAVGRAPPEIRDAAVTAVDASAEAEAPRALAGFPEILELREGADVVGAVSVPLGARGSRPIMIALHGGSDRAARACAAWRVAVEAYPFVVCPRGWGGDEARLGWRSVEDSKARMARAVAAVKSTFGAWVKETGTVVLVGFSMGASWAARVAESEPRTYRRIVVGDSAHDPWPALSFSRAWSAGGGERAMFMCTTSGCEPSMRAAAKKVPTYEVDASPGASARLVVAPTQVHALSTVAASALRRDWSWLVEGAEGWEEYVAPTELSVEGRTESFEPR